MRHEVGKFLFFFTIFLIRHGTLALTDPSSISPRPSVTSTDISLIDGLTADCEKCKSNSTCRLFGGSYCADGVCYTEVGKCLITGLFIKPNEPECKTTLDCSLLSICINNVCKPCAEDERIVDGACVKKVLTAAKLKSLVGGPCSTSDDCISENSVCTWRHECGCDLGYVGYAFKCVKQRKLWRFFRRPSVHVFMSALSNLGEACTQDFHCKHEFYEVECRSHKCQCRSAYTEKRGKCVLTYLLNIHDDASSNSNFGSDYNRPSYETDYGSSNKRTKDVAKIVSGIVTVIICVIALACYYAKRNAAHARYERNARRTYQPETPATTTWPSSQYSGYPAQTYVAYEPNTPRPYPVQSYTAFTPATHGPSSNTTDLNYSMGPPMPDQPPNYEEVMRSSNQQPLDGQNSLPDYNQAAQMKR